MQIVDIVNLSWPNFTNVVVIISIIILIFSYKNVKFFA
jgi:hypothetical protein